jgi:hypothetical protein
MSDPHSSGLRKRQLEAGGARSARAADEVDIASCATTAYSSEDPARPVEHLLDGRSGPGATRWISARPDAIEQIVVEFDQPQTISRLVYEAEEALRERTQEVRVEVSDDGGRTYRQVLVSGVHLQSQGSHLPARRTAAQSQPAEPSPPYDCSKQGWLGHCNTYFTSSIPLTSLAESQERKAARLWGTAPRR